MEIKTIEDLGKLKVGMPIVGYHKNKVRRFPRVVTITKCGAVFCSGNARCLDDYIKDGWRFRVGMLPDDPELFGDVEVGQKLRVYDKMGRHQYDGTVASVTIGRYISYNPLESFGALLIRLGFYYIPIPKEKKEAVECPFVVGDVCEYENDIVKQRFTIVRFTDKGYLEVKSEANGTTHIPTNYFKYITLITPAPSSLPPGVEPFSVGDQVQMGIVGTSDRFDEVFTVKTISRSVEGSLALTQMEKEHIFGIPEGYYLKNLSNPITEKSSEVQKPEPVCRECNGEGRVCFTGTGVNAVYGDCPECNRPEIPPPPAFRTRYMESLTCSECGYKGQKREEPKTSALNDVGQSAKEFRWNLIMNGWRL